MPKTWTKPALEDRRREVSGRLADRGQLRRLDGVDRSADGGQVLGENVGAIAHEECVGSDRSLALPDAFGNAPAAVDDQLGAGDEPRGRLAEIKRGLGHVVGRPGTAGDRLLGRQVGPDSGVVRGPGGHRRVDQARGEQVEPDPVRGIPRRGRQGQRADGPLAGGVGERAEMRRRRRTVQDRPHVHHRASQAGGVERLLEHEPHGRAVGQERRRRR